MQCFGSRAYGLRAEGLGFRSWAYGFRVYKVVSFGFIGERIPIICIEVGSIPHPVMGTKREYCRYNEARLTPCLRAIFVGGIDLTLTGKPELRSKEFRQIRCPPVTPCRFLIKIRLKVLLPSSLFGI